MKKLLFVLSLFAASITGAANLEEVVVTAQRKAQSLQEVPLSVSALSSNQMGERQVEVVKQILTNSPNLLGNNNVATTTALSIFIRGVGTTENLATAETSVGVYVDGVYMARQGFNNLGLHDVESIEVLRGPQGVFYGRNTNGGAIKINLNKPVFQEQMSYNVSYGDVEYTYGDVMLNAAINDNIAIRASGNAYNYNGFVDAVNLKKQVNNGEGKAGRFAVRFVNESVDANLSADYSEVSTNGNFHTDIAGILNSRPSSLFTTLSTVDAKNINETSGITLNVTYGDPQSFEIQSITGYRKLDQLINADASGNPISLYTVYQDQKSEQLSQELQFVGKFTSDINYVGGLYYFDEQSDVYLADNLRTAPSAAALNIAKTFTVNVSNYAAYGQLEYKWNKFILSAGARYTSEDRKLDIIQTSNNPSALFNFNSAALNSRGVATKKTYNDTTPRFGISYRYNSRIFAYASYTEGFRAGGWTGRASRVDQYINFNPENVETIEAGLKLDGGFWRLHTSVFSTDYVDLFNTLTVNGVFTVQTADAKISGLETEGQWQINSWLNVYGSAGLLESRYVGVRPANLAAELQRSPEYQVKVGAKVNWNNFTWNVGVYDASEYRLTPANLAVTAPALANRGIELTDPPVLVDTSLVWSINDSSSLKFACTNCTDKEYVEGAVYIGQWAGAWAGDSRMWTVTFSQKF